MRHLLTKRFEQRGFTLIELMIAITMLSILLSWGWPSFDSYVQSNRIVAESNRLIANFNYARSEASSRARVVTIQSSADGGQDWTEGWEIYTDTDANGNTARIAADTFLREATPSPAGVTINGNDAADLWISFRTNGMLNEGGSTIVLAICDERGEADGRDLTINLAGRINVTNPSADCTP